MTNFEIFSQIVTSNDNVRKALVKLYAYMGHYGEDRENYHKDFKEELNKLTKEEKKEFYSILRKSYNPNVRIIKKD